MGNRLSPVLANIFMLKLKQDVVQPHNPPFYDQYVNKIFSKRKRNDLDIMLESLSSYHDNINFTVETNPNHFPDSTFRYHNDRFEQHFHGKPGKYPTHWASQAPTRWRRNVITGAVHRAKCISSNLTEYVKHITEVFHQALRFTSSFIQSTVDSFLPNQQGEE